MDDNSEEAPTFAVYQSVRCLECGAVYAKPSRGGTARSNPGCPECGYVGWLTEDLPVGGGNGQPRFDEDRPLRRSARSR